MSAAALRWFPDEMPAPAASADTLPWWQAAAEHRLVVQACAACGATRHPPGPRCPCCRSADVEWRDLSGRGAVYSYTVVHQAFVPALGDRLPYVVAAIDLDKFTEDDTKTGAKIILRALEEPLRQIAENAGLEGSVVVNEVRQAKGAVGLNAATGEFVDLIEAGVIDPAMVTRSALQNAASIAKNILTTEAIVAEVPEKDGGGGGGMPDMSGMM